MAGNLIGVETMGEENEFLNKYNIQKFSKSENKGKLTFQYKKQLTNDVEKLLKVKSLEEKLNELKKLNKYKFILDEVDSVFEHVELLFNNNLEINSGEIVSGNYIGNVVIDFNIVTHYKGVNDVEKFKQLGKLKYASTESESFKKIGGAMYKNIAKDMFTSLETQKYVNLNWKDIKGDKSDSDAYLGSNNQLKKYFNKSDEFHKLLLKTINDKYFKSQFPSIDISYDKKSIYETYDFAQQNKNYLIVNNFYKSDDDIASLNMINSEEHKLASEILQGKETSIVKFLQKYQFNFFQWSKFRKNYKIAQNAFIKNF